MVPCPPNPAQNNRICKRMGKLTKCKIRLWLSLRPKSPKQQISVTGTTIKVNLLLGKVRGLAFVYNLSSCSLQGNLVLSFLASFYLENVHPPFLEGLFPFIVHSFTSQPSSCTFQGISQDTCPHQDPSKDGRWSC